jgi:hypothetical protein
MRTFSRQASILATLAILGAASTACLAQDQAPAAAVPNSEAAVPKWEIGALGGGGFYNSASVSSPAGSGAAGIKNGLAVGAYVGNNMYKLLGGELRYEFLPGDLKVSSGGTQATFTGQAQAMHYDFLVHFTPAGSRIRPFVSAGAGVKLYQGTAKATVTQPLSNLALLTNTHQIAGLGVFGGGVKAQISSHFVLRFEVQDFLTPFPRQVIAPAPGAKISGLLSEIVFLMGIGITF